MHDFKMLKKHSKLYILRSGLTHIAYDFSDISLEHDGN